MIKITAFIFSFILAQVAIGMELSFKTDRENGKMRFQADRLAYITPQKSESIKHSFCSTASIVAFQKRLVELVKKEGKPAAKKFPGLLFIDGRTFGLERGSKLYKTLDSFHDEIRKVKSDIKFNCLGK